MIQYLLKNNITLNQNKHLKIIAEKKKKKIFKPRGSRANQARYEVLISYNSNSLEKTENVSETVILCYSDGIQLVVTCRFHP